MPIYVQCKKSENNVNFSVKKSDKEDDYLLNFVVEEKIGRVWVNPNVEKFLYKFAEFCVFIEEEF